MGDLIVCSNSLIYFLIFLLGPAVTGESAASPRRTDTPRPGVKQMVSQTFFRVCVAINIV